MVDRWYCVDADVAYDYSKPGKQQLIYLFPILKNKIGFKIYLPGRREDEKENETYRLTVFPAIIDKCLKRFRRRFFCFLFCFFLLRNSICYPFLSSFSQE